MIADHVIPPNMGAGYCATGLHREQWSRARELAYKHCVRMRMHNLPTQSNTSPPRSLFFTAITTTRSVLLIQLTSSNCSTALLLSMMLNGLLAVRGLGIRESH